MPAMGLIEPDGPHQAIAALDTLPRSTRVLGEFGFAGALAFIVEDGDPPVAGPAATRTYPDAETARVYFRMYGVPITPGHVIGLDVVALPGGPTQWEPTTGNYEESGRGGSIDMAVTYRNGDAQTVDAACSVSPPGSEQVYGAIPVDAFDAMEVYEATAVPWAQLPSAADLEKWTRGGDVVVDIVVSVTGSPRPCDVAIVERPAQIVVDLASSTWPAAMYTAAGAAYPSLPSDYPITKLTTNDPAGGMESLRRAVEQAGVQLGPCLMWWTSAVEDGGGTALGAWVSYDGGTGDDEAPPKTISNTAFRNLPYITAPPTVGLPGYQLGGYARQVTASDDWLDGRTGVLPVYFAAYANADAGIVQARAGDDEWSAINIVADTGSYGWKITAGWIEVGTSPEDGPVGRFYAREENGDPCAVRYAGVFFRP